MSALITWVTEALAYVYLGVSGVVATQQKF